MRWPWRAKREVRGPVTLHRSFVTPEGVDLRLELGSAASRAAAFLIDAVIIIVAAIAATIAAILLGSAKGGPGEAVAIIWLVGVFVLRNGWFVLFEIGSRGATPGKRLLGLRVIARDGGRLSGSAVITRNAMREIEVFLPLSFLGYQSSQGLADGFLTLFALLWSGIFMLFPLFNRDRLRVGDLLAGTWVVQNVRHRLGDDLSRQSAPRPTRVFSDAALDLYGIYELQTLEEVLRKRREEAIVTVAATIRRKAGLPYDGDDYDFLSDYYTALCARLERGMMLGRRRADKHSRTTPR